MINFYREWKEDKENSRNAPKKRPKPANKCKICGKAVNGLKDHVRDHHGVGMWERYVAAEQQMKQQELDQFRKLL